MKKKTHNSNINAGSKPTSPFEEVFDIFTLRQRPISIDYIEQLAQQSVQSALTKKNDLKVMQFFHKLGYDSDSIARWKARSEKFTQLYEQRKKIIADKREVGALLKDHDESKEYARMNENFVRLSMPLYDPEWLELEKQRAQLAKEQEAEKVEYVVVESFKKEE